MDFFKFVELEVVVGEREVERHVCAKGTNLYTISIKNELVITTLILWVDHPIGGVKTESPVITHVHTFS